ncbi:MAG: MmgE/PrpD family protein [Burkholderiales bacterium]
MTQNHAETVIRRIGDYVATLSWQDIDSKVADYAKRILLDSLACGYGGLQSEPARIVRNAITELDSSGAQATVLGTGTKANAQFAALANGVAIRYQDYNDVYFGPAWTAHPSDTIATVLACAEWMNRSGRDFLLGMIAAYEVQLRFSDLPVPKNLWHRGWHHTAACAYAGAAGAGRMLGLNGSQIAHAMALAGARSNTFSEIRHGDIEMDKALSAPIVASQAVLYSLLARQGFTGCSTLLEGPYGFGAAVAGGVDVEPLVPEPGDFRIMKIGLKPYPVEGMTPAMVQAAIELKREHKLEPEEITSIRILAHEEAVTKPSWDEHKLAPTSKETADHSFFYCVAVALVAGECTSEQFTDPWLKNPAVAKLMKVSTLEAKPELTAMFKKGARPAAVEVTTRRGVFQREVLYPKGDPNNPMTWADVTQKFKTQSEPILDSAVAQEIVERVAGIEAEKNVRSFAERLGSTRKY